MKLLATSSPAMLCLVSLLVTACTKETPKQPAPQAEGPKPRYFQESRESTTATVEAVDQTTRMVTVKNEAGDLITFRAGDEVQNLPQVQVGDRVLVDYYQSIAIQVEKPEGEPVNDARTAAARLAEPGEKPAGIAAQHITVTAIVRAIDPATPAVTLEGPEGKQRTVRIRNPKNLENVKVGDHVVITYTESVAVAVRKAE
jgi:hypothetical protein